MRLQKKSYSRICLLDLLRRRKTSLKKFLNEFGIISYELLKIRCNSMGVIPPSEEDFSAVIGSPVMHGLSSPTEGIVVLDSPSTRSVQLEPNDPMLDSNDNNAVVQQKKKSKKNNS